ncbi:MAG: septum formation initiator family protein [bacterium]
MRAASPKIMISIATVVVIFILVSLAQEMNRRLQVQREVAGLQQEVRNMEKKVIEMESLNQYFGTDDFLERMAREKLGFKAEGETVVLVTEDQPQAEPQIAGMQIAQEGISTPRKWWHVFFVAPLEQ